MEEQFPESASEDKEQNQNQTIPMVLITLPQRAALIEFMAKQPYSDVANGIEFLRNAPQVDVTIAPPESVVEKGHTDAAS
jgi:hypothetical protein